jgi:hypothetical protein
MAVTTSYRGWDRERPKEGLRQPLKRPLAGAGRPAPAGLRLTPTFER